MVPSLLLSKVSESLERLNLADNYFNYLGTTGTNQGNKTFPLMSQLSVLILDNCFIRSIHLQTFSTLPHLHTLSLQSNPLHMMPPAVLLPTVQVLKIGIQQDVGVDIGDEFFSFPPSTFNKHNMEKLNVLEIHNANFGNLSDYHFSGLLNLEHLSLARSKFFYFTDMLFGNLTSLKSLSLAYVESSNPIELKHFQGPSNLEYLDLTFSTLNLSSAAKPLLYRRTELDEEVEVNPIFLLFKTLKVLNLTGSLLNLDVPLQNLFLEYVENLTTFEVGENKIKHWNQTVFKNNQNLKHFKMPRNGLDIRLTDEMITDLFENTRLDTLDLSENSFLCSDQVFTFFQETLNHTSMHIINYNNGTGYSCIDSNGTEITFLDFASRGSKVTEGIDVTDDSRKYFLIGVALGVGVIVVAVLGVYKKRWYIKYHYYWLIKKPINREEPFHHDVFISYCHQDESWVKTKLIPSLEESDIGVCYHDRDFAAGKSIVENIVDSLDRSRKCLLVLSRSYVESSWCVFEAHLASNRLIQVRF